MQSQTINKIRIKHYLSSMYGWKKLNIEYIDEIRRVFESFIEEEDKKRTEGGLVFGNGFFGLIEPGSYKNEKIENEWISFVRGAISRELC